MFPILTPAPQFFAYDIPDLQAWYDTTNAAYLQNGSDLPPSLGEGIARALDRSGNGNHTAKQMTGTAQPTFTAAQINGLPSGVFDGGDTLALPAALYSIPNGSLTIITVSKRNTEAGTNSKVVSLSEGGALRTSMEYSLSTGIVNFLSNATGAGSAQNPSNTNTNYQILTGFRSGTTQSISVNGDTAVTNTNGADEAGCDAGFIGSLAGSGNFLTGGISEILIYNRALTAAEITQVNRYLSNKFAITLAQGLL